MKKKRKSKKVVGKEKVGLSCLELLRESFKLMGEKWKEKKREKGNVNEMGKRVLK
jgi:hypothetical protein